MYGCNSTAEQADHITFPFLLLITFYLDKSRQLFDLVKYGHIHISHIILMTTVSVTHTGRLFEETKYIYCNI